MDETLTDVGPLTPARPSRRWTVRRATPFLGLLCAGLSVFLAMNGLRQHAAPGTDAAPTARPSAAAQPSPAPPTGGTSTAPPAPRVPFAFPAHRTVAVPAELGGPNDAASRAADLVAGTLSELYDGGFIDPEGWDRSVPSQVWDAFAPGVRSRAMEDASSFTVAALPANVEAMEVTASSLTIRILLGPNGSAQAAVAGLTLQAEGALESGEAVAVSSHATLLLRPIEGRWQIVAYPETGTEIAPLPPPSPSPTSAPSTGPAPEGPRGGYR